MVAEAGGKTDSRGKDFGGHKPTSIILLMSPRADSSVAERSAIQSRNGGLIPTSALHFRVASLHEVQPIIELLHYSHSIFGVTSTHSFAAIHDDRIVGAAVFGNPAGMGVARKYAGSRPLLELRRLVLEDACGKNSESRFIGFTLRELRKQGVHFVLAYSDPSVGHVGTVYRATGFNYVGVTAARKHWNWKGKTYPDRNVHQTKFPFHLQLRAAIASGEASPVRIPGKHIFVKEIFHGP